MNTYRIKTSDSTHLIEGAAFVTDSRGLTIYDTEGKAQAIFSTFDWMRVEPVKTEPLTDAPKADAKTDESSTSAPAVLGE